MKKKNALKVLAGIATTGAVATGIATVATRLSKLNRSREYLNQFCNDTNLFDVPEMQRYQRCLDEFKEFIPFAYRVNAEIVLNSFIARAPALLYPTFEKLPEGVKKKIIRFIIDGLMEDKTDECGFEIGSIEPDVHIIVNKANELGKVTTKILELADDGSIQSDAAKDFLRIIERLCDDITDILEDADYCFMPMRYERMLECLINDCGYLYEENVRSDDVAFNRWLEKFTD